MRYFHFGYPGQHAGCRPGNRHRYRRLVCQQFSRQTSPSNHLNNITVELGDASLLKGREPFDVVIANINRNILLNDMHAYVDCMHSGSEIYMSGFYVEDIDAIRQCGENLGLEFVGYREKNRWAAVKLIKK